MHFIVAALEEFRALLFGQQMTVHTNHKNTLHGDSAHDRITCWQLLTEEHQPEIHHIAAKDNMAVDALSCMEMNLSPSKEVSASTQVQEQEGLMRA